MTHEGGVADGCTRNISLGGMYVLTDAAVPYGTRVDVEVVLPALGQSATLDAVVRWQGPDGVGVQFGSLRAREVWALNLLFRSAPVSE